MVTSDKHEKCTQTILEQEESVNGQLCERAVMGGRGALIPAERIEQRILVIRWKKSHAQRGFGRAIRVSAKAPNQAVKRNPDRFSDDFMFRLSRKEKEQVGTDCDHLRLRCRLEAPESKYDAHDAQIKEIFDAIRALMEPPTRITKRRIGFLVEAAE